MNSFIGLTLATLAGLASRDVAQGTTAVIRFANLALDEHLVRARERGASVDDVEPIDQADLRRGWKVRPPE